MFGKRFKGKMDDTENSQDNNNVKSLEGIDHEMVGFLYLNPKKGNREDIIKDIKDYLGNLPGIKDLMEINNEDAVESYKDLFRSASTIRNFKEDHKKEYDKMVDKLDDNTKEAIKIVAYDGWSALEHIYRDGDKVPDGMYMIPDFRHLHEFEETAKHEEKYNFMTDSIEKWLDKGDDTEISIFLKRLTELSKLTPEKKLRANNFAEAIRKREEQKFLR